ncbi:MAG: CDP-alcohol phosphatidyltransferase family protein [Acidobacteriaceae bacterium]
MGLIVFVRLGMFNVFSQLRAAPNQLTLLRLCIIPFLVNAVLEGDFRIAFVLFVLAGISDGLDGLLARWLKQRTVLGQYLDPIADKLLLSTLFLVLTRVGLVRRYITVLVFSRDLGILVVATLLFAIAGLRDFRPSILGKANTLAQIAALTAVLFSQLYAPMWLILLRRGAMICTVVLTVASGFHYVWLVGRRLSALGVPNSSSHPD